MRSGIEKEIRKTAGSQRFKVHRHASGECQKNPDRGIFQSLAARCQVTTKFNAMSGWYLLSDRIAGNEIDTIAESLPTPRSPHMSGKSDRDACQL
jgi:hypothetical protein